MKHNLVLLLFSVVLFTACNNAGTAENEYAADTSLPEGKLVIDEYSEVKVMDPKTGAFNNYDKDNPGKSGTDKSSGYDNLKKQYKNLLVFHVADTMRIKRSYIATLVLGKDQVLASVKDEVLENAIDRSDSLYMDTSMDIGSRMKARLIDMSGAENKGFLIELLGGEDAATQSITAKRKKILWQWKLTPQTTGQQELRLSINVVERDGETVNLPAKNIAIVIFAEEESFTTKASKFFDEYGKWILASILIPIFVAWFTTRMRNKSPDRRQPKANDPEPGGATAESDQKTQA